MTNDTPMSDFPAILEPADLAQFSEIAMDEYLAQRTELARQWLAHATHLMTVDEVDLNAVLLAICSANDNLTEIESLKPILAGIEAGVEELTRQRDETTEAYEQLAEELEERVRQGVDRGLVDALEQAFATDEDAEEAEIDMLARQMVLGDEQDVIDEATKLLVRKLRKAQELAGEYRANGLPDEEYTEDPDDDGDFDDDELA